jgi:hypothetical protein
MVHICSYSCRGLAHHPFVPCHGDEYGGSLDDSAHLWQDPSNLTEED